MNKTKTERFETILKTVDIPYELIEYPHCKKIAILTNKLGSETITKLYFVGFESISIGTNLKGRNYFVLNY